MYTERERCIVCVVREREREREREMYGIKKTNLCRIDTLKNNFVRVSLLIKGKNI